MKHILVSCKDIKSGLFTTPTPFRTEGEAVRAFGEAIPRDPMLSKYPADFELHSIAEWDNETGEIVVAQKRICGIADIYTPTESGSEVSAVAGGKFPEVPSEGAESVVQEDSLDLQEGRIRFGGNKK